MPPSLSVVPPRALARPYEAAQQPVLYGFTQQQRTKVYLVASLRDRVVLPTQPWAWNSPSLASTLGITPDIAALVDAWHRYGVHTQWSAVVPIGLSHVALNGHCLTFLDDKSETVCQELYTNEPVTEAHLLAWTLYRAVEKKLQVHPEVLTRTDRVLSQAAGIRSVGDLALEVRANEDAS